jgi:orotidine-5'-phosphate decarboxylase
LVESWGLAYDLAGLEAFTMTCVEAFAGEVASVKPQSAFFEVFGSRGVAVLERAVDAFTEAGTIVILDAKRGDIGSTMEAYADAYLADGSPLAADAITLSPYLGFGSLAPAFERAHRYSRGVYVLARTSNPEGGSVQLALAEEGSVVQGIIDAATELNHVSRQKAVGLVVGGTHSTLGCDLSDFNGSILVPGIGFQGGRMEDLPALFGDAVDQVLAVVGRGVIQAGPDRAALRGKVDELLG